MSTLRSRQAQVAPAPRIGEAERPEGEARGRMSTLRTRQRSSTQRQ
jgi:hypothetical protein